MTDDSRRKAGSRKGHDDEQPDRDGERVSAGPLSPGVRREGAGLMLEADPRLDQQSETESELEQLVQSNRKAEKTKRAKE